MQLTSMSSLLTFKASTSCLSRPNTWKISISTRETRKALFSARSVIRMSRTASLFVCAPWANTKPPSTWPHLDRYKCARSIESLVFQFKEASSQTIVAKKTSILKLSWTDIKSEISNKRLLLDGLTAPGMASSARSPGLEAIWRPLRIILSFPCKTCDYPPSI